jgi:hypothetical protein
MGLHIGHARPGADGPLDALGDLMRGPQIEIGRKLQMQRHAHRPVLLKDRDVVRFPDQRFGQRDRQHALAQIDSTAAGLDVHDHVAIGQGVLERGLNQVGRLVTLDHGLAGRNGYDNVGEVPSGGLS